MIMKTKFVWLLTYLFAILATDKNIIYKHHLRGLIEKERNREIQKIINTEYQQIYNKILQEKTIGVSKIQFTILCFDLDLKHHKNDPNIFNSVRNNHVETLKIIQLYKIPIDTTASTIIDKLKISFPDSNIIRKTNSNNDENKCIEYTLFL